MKKIYLVSLGALLVITLVLVGIYQIQESKNSILDSTKEPERVIIFQTTKDLDNDGKKERVVLDEVKGYEDPFGVYSRILIFEILNNKKENLIFDSQKEGLSIEGTYFDNPRELLRIVDLNKNGMSEIYLTEQDTSTDTLTIIEKRKGNYRIMYHGMIHNYRYEDFDNDGTLEFYGITDNLIGDPSFKKETIFKITDNGYSPSYKLTRQYVEKEFEKVKQETSVGQNYGNFRYLTSYYAVLGLKEEGIDFIKKNWNFTKPEDQEQYMKKFEQSISGWEKWWESLK